MRFENRAWVLANVAALLLVLVSTRLVYWQLIRRDLEPVALNPLTAVSSSANNLEKRDDKDLTQKALDFLTGQNATAPLTSLPPAVVQRTEDLMNSIRRGSIYDRNGRLLAYDYLDANGNKARFYTEPSLAPVIGYVSGLRTGIAGLEYSYNDTLLGLNRPDAQVSQMIHQPVTGSDLTLAIDSRIQRAAAQALGPRSGSVTVLDGRSGAVLAMVSQPTFDPNRVLDPQYVSGLLQGCGSPKCQGPFLNRATQALYPPGSTWKTVTLIAALDTGQVNKNTVFDFGQPVKGPNGSYYVYRVGGGIIPDPNHTENRLTLPLSYAKSANAAFAKIGDQMPPQTLIKYAESFGFSASSDKAFPFDLPYSPSTLANNINDIVTNDLLRAATAIGQGELQVTPLSMAMVVLAVENDGNLPVPYFVQSVHSPLVNLPGGPPNQHTLNGLMKADTARQVRDMMITVVTQGYGAPAAVAGLTVGGKTGTAQLGGNQQPHAWFIGFAEDSKRAVVIVVQVENGGEGSQVAGPIFAQVANVAMRQMGQPVPEVVPNPPPPWTLPGAGAGLAGSPTPAANPTPTPAAAPETNLGPTPAPRPGLSPDITFKKAGTKPTVSGSGECKANPNGPNPAGIQATGAFNWPAEIHTLASTGFKAGHPGIDLETPEGTPVYAADTGVVIFAGWTDSGYGNTVIIDHGNGYQTLYGQLSQVVTSCGAAVQQGAVIGLSGSSGDSGGPRLHFEVRVPNGFVNPGSLLPPP
ncbi:MAG TPA: penicillin-binding transpeptidase domain-containing protein [Anaerolineales bacterium]